MKNLSKWIVAAVMACSGSALTGLSASAQGPAEAMYGQAIKQRMNSRDVLAELGPGLHVVTVGTGSPLPDPTRAGPMTAVIADGRVFIIDTGGASVREFRRFGLPVGGIEAVLLSHFHSDHIDGLGELALAYWANGASEPMPVYGGEGVQTVVDGINAAYSLDKDYRIAHHGAKTLLPSGAGMQAMTIDMANDKMKKVILDEDGLKITAFRVTHDPVKPALGFRFDHAGRSVVISGDTSYSENLVDVAEGADLLVHEALNPQMVGMIEAAARAAGNKRRARIMSDIPTYHTSPVEAARAAKEAGIDRLVLTHIVPVLPNKRLVPLFLKGVDAEWDGPVEVAEDGNVYSLKPQGGEIEDSDLR